MYLDADESGNAPLLEIRGLTKVYGRQAARTRALDNVFFTVCPGEFLGIMGPSGSGKTTLLNLISTIDRPTEGSVTVGGTNLKTLKPSQAADFRSRRLGFIFQDYNLLTTLTGFENIMLPLSLAGVRQAEAAVRIRKVAVVLGVADLLDRFPDQMSRGEAQRVAACRAVVGRPDIILADEPTGALDSVSSRQLLELLQSMRTELGATLLMVTHDPVAASYCSRILFLKDGSLYHELKREQTASREVFYGLIIDVLRDLGDPGVLKDGSHV
ncbi:MAG: ABC transporter ATP-binding protein [Saccharofermentanales bacterium]|jgi:putative ABC transport system ATP-binding protein